jgi:hypothetical protein
MRCQPSGATESGRVMRSALPTLTGSPTDLMFTAPLRLIEV